MARVNDNYLKLDAGYLFPEIGRRVTAFQQKNPDAKIIRLGIGDVVRAARDSRCRRRCTARSTRWRRESGFRGYGPEQGYDFLREAIARERLSRRAASTSTPDEIFVSDGSKCDSGNVQEIFAADAKIAITDPGLSGLRRHERDGRAHRQAGRVGGATRGSSTCRRPKRTASARSRRARRSTSSTSAPRTIRPAPSRRGSSSRAWVEWAKRTGAILLYDAAYEAYITDPAIPHSIFEIPGARDVAIEFRSFSKTAGFTGTRCAFIVVPKGLAGRDAAGKDVSIHALWSRRHTTKFNGVSYPVQRGARRRSTPTKASAQIREVIALLPREREGHSRRARQGRASRCSAA